MNGLYDTSTVEFWKDHLRRGDLYYFNVPPSSPSFPDMISIRLSRYQSFK